MYEDLIKELRYLEKVYSICGNTSTKEYKLTVEAADVIEELSKPQWIKFTTRPLDEEEKKENPEWCYILDCELPDDGQEILISNGRWVTVDTFFSDDGCYLDSNGDLEGLWWMPLPEPPKEEA